MKTQYSTLYLTLTILGNAQTAEAAMPMQESLHSIVKLTGAESYYESYIDQDLNDQGIVHFDSDQKTETVIDDSRVSASLSVPLIHQAFETMGATGAAQTSIGTNRASVSSRSIYIPIYNENHQYLLNEDNAEYLAQAQSTWVSPLISSGNYLGTGSFSVNVDLHAEMNPDTSNTGVALAYAMTLLPANLDLSTIPENPQQVLAEYTQAILVGDFANGNPGTPVLGIGPDIGINVGNNPLIGPNSEELWLLQTNFSRNLTFTWDNYDYSQNYYLIASLYVRADATGLSWDPSAGDDFTHTSVDAEHTAQVLSLIVPEGVSLSGANGALPFAVTSLHPVPLPGAAWFLLSGLGVFFLGMRKRH